MNVTVLEMMERVLQRVTAPVVSGFYTRIHGEEGVSIRCGVGVSGFRGNGRVAKVLCSDGSEFAADLVIIGVGILPNTALAEAAGLEVDNGIVVNGRAQTSDPDIFAAGDCTNHHNPIYDRPHPAGVGAERHGPVQGRLPALPAARRSVTTRFPGSGPNSMT